MFSSGCDECKPGGHGSSNPATFLLSSTPFLASFVIVFVGHLTIRRAAVVGNADSKQTVALRTLFPLLSGENALTGNATSKNASTGPTSRPTVKRLAAFTFSTTVALATVLIELILCEISNTVNPSARALALRITGTSCRVPGSS